MPTHVDMPQGWQEHARRRSAEVTDAVEAARAQREERAPIGRDELSRRRIARLAAQENARARTTMPPPPPFSAA